MKKGADQAYQAALYGNLMQIGSVTNFRTIDPKDVFKDPEEDS